MLIDFRELLGSHTGDNMGDAVWETFVMYNIQDKVLLLIFCPDSKLNFKQIIAFMMDNASNMDTFVDAIKKHMDLVDIDFDTEWACLRCLPHTTHLAAIEVPYLYQFVFFGVN
jgi:hypothetical protein